MKHLLIYSLSLSVFIFGCVYDPPNGRVTIINKSDSTMYIYLTCADSLPIEPNLKLFYIDTGRVNADGKKMDSIIIPNYRVLPNDTTFLGVFGSAKTPTVPCENNHNVQLFFISEKTLKSEKWQEICSKQLFSKKMNFSQHQLDSMKWTIIYE